MLLVFVLAAALWGIGALMKAPFQARALMVGLLYVGVLALHVILPEGHPLRDATGGSPALWLLIGGVVAVLLAYREGLKRLRARADARTEEAEPRASRSFSDAELNRYARHIVLREVGGAGQKALRNASVLVVGAGGLGAPALQYLAAAGIGTIGVVDDDVVDSANLHRQVIHKDASIDMPKVFSAQAEMVAQNPFVTVKPYHRRLDADTAEALFAEYDIILDGTDNFETRYLVNRAAVLARKPLISGALTQWEGQLSVFDPASGGPCYQCIFPQAPDPSLAPPCAEAGVIGPLPGVIGTMMALEAVKLITGAGTSLQGEMLIYDGLYGETRKIALKRREGCPACGA
ncbi:molybdopterin-synthase adenylyltransferase MoeB [Aliishimia ponticola]|uniref:Molybdopterin-synthase adenylyltransferase n=1 Tax=Aliishimia ponticola TaxID=2499833 RepID=A0A4S4NB33_9RHOB|nr:molybdopterin-synthase adenylyltransferase MoeB [Aliishimia ponticola]THH35238.1 molybdopterin-synthase adenylyltransferase MoeB [Aliishimia ponticola]